MEESNPVSTPLDENKGLTCVHRIKEERKLMESIPYQQAIGSLLMCSKLILVLL